MPLDERLRQRFAALDALGLRRELPEVRNRDGVRYSLRGRSVIGFCSNDYLGLAQTTQTTPSHSGSGSGSSRLICGDLDLHRTAEQRLARLAGTADAVLFPSGFQLNVGVLAAVLSSEDIVYSDALNHASIIDGLRLSRANRVVLPHRGVPPRGEPVGPGGLRWWVSETIFSMDGDAAAPDALHKAHDDGFDLYLDDAHGFGLFQGGRGWSQAHGISPTLYVGTLSKALGCAGAFVAGSATACQWIRTRARSFVFSTGTSPRVVSDILTSLELLTGPVGDRARTRLRENLAHLTESLGLPAVPTSPIIPILLGQNERAVAVAEALFQRGFHIQAIRPPTVPTGMARLRLTVTASHTPAQIDALVGALREVLGTSTTLLHTRVST